MMMRALGAALLCLALACSRWEPEPPVVPPPPLEPAPNLILVTETHTITGPLPEAPVSQVALLPDARSERVAMYAAVRRDGFAHSIVRLGEGDLATSAWETTPSSEALDTDDEVRFVVADLDGDEQAELLVRTLHGVYVFDFDGAVRTLADLSFNWLATVPPLEVEEGVVHGSGPATFWFWGVDHQRPPNEFSRVYLHRDLCGEELCFAELPVYPQLVHQEGDALLVYGTTSVVRCELDRSARRYRCGDARALWPRDATDSPRRMPAFARCKGGEFRVFLGHDPAWRGVTFGWMVAGDGLHVDRAAALAASEHDAPVPGIRLRCDEDATEIDAVVASDLGLAWQALRCQGERCARAREAIEFDDGASYARLVSDVPGYAEVRDGEITLHRWVETRSR